MGAVLDTRRRRLVGLGVPTDRTNDDHGPSLPSLERDS